MDAHEHTFKPTDPQRGRPTPSLSCSTIQDVLLLRGGQVGGDATPLLPVPVLSIIMNITTAAEGRVPLISCAGMSHCHHSVYWLLPLLQLTVGERLCAQYAHTCSITQRAVSAENKHIQGERKGSLSVQLASCSAGRTCRLSTWLPSQTGASPSGSHRSSDQPHT